MSVDAVSIPTTPHLVVTHGVRNLLSGAARAWGFLAHDLESQPVVNAEPKFTIMEV